MHISIFVRNILTALWIVYSLGWIGIAVADSASELERQAKRTDQIATTQGTTTVGNRIASDFKTFSGSQRNADALVTGLRNSSEITLTSGSDTATFTPKTGKMGWGNVFISLSLAQTELKAAGITSPTPEQLQTALNGGTVTLADGKTVTFGGILAQRASGMGWGQIAQRAGVKLGPVVARIRSGNDRLDKIASRPEHAMKTSTSESAVHAERPMHADRPDLPQRPDRPERAGKN